MRVGIVLNSRREIALPALCLVCENKKSHERNLIVARQIPRHGKSDAMSITLKLPYCDSCYSRESNIFYVTFFPMVIIGALSAIALFIITLPYAPDITTSNGATGLAVPAAAALFGGLICGTIAEIVSRIIFLPLLGSPLLKLPLFIVDFFSDAYGNYGLVARISRDGEILEIDFGNEKFAEQVKILNEKSLAKK